MDQRFLARVCENFRRDGATHRTWEHTAIASVTQGSHCIRHEVFNTGDLDADRLFAFLFESPVDDRDRRPSQSPPDPPGPPPPPSNSPPPP